MSVQKCKSSANFNVDGSAYARYAHAVTGVIVNRGLNTPYSSGNLNTKDQEMAAWSTNSYIDSTGSVIFSNSTHGGSLTSLTLANRGNQSVVVGFNNSNPSTASGFIVPTGGTIQIAEDEVITKIWAITPASTTGSIAGFGFFQTSKYFEPQG
jgi:hypothetical protein